MNFVLSAKRCGSTILQNIGHIVTYGRRGRLIKHHDAYKVVEGNKLVPIRDPRDMVVSMRRTVLGMEVPITDLGFVRDERIVWQLNVLHELYQKYKEDPTALILRYEEMFKDGLGNYEHVTKLLCEFLNVEFTDELMETVNTELNFDKLKKVSDSIESFTDYDYNVGYKEGFGIHGKHIGSSKVSEWKDVIPEHLHTELNELLKELLTNLDYDITDIRN